MKKILILAIMIFGLNTNVFAWYNMLEAAQAGEIAYSKKPSEMTKKEKKLFKKYKYDLNYDYSAIRKRPIQDKKEDNSDGAKNENKTDGSSEDKLRKK